MAASLLAIVADTTPWNKKTANSAQTPYYDMLRHSLEWACLSIIFNESPFMCMAANTVSQLQVRSLYRRLLRQGRLFADFNFR